MNVEESLEVVDKDVGGERDGRYFQVDALKAIMIFLVIFDHTIPWSFKNYIWVELWERISIPVFLIIMGFNMANSFKKQGAKTLKELYSVKYFKSKIVRYIIPFLILYLISTIVGLILYGGNIDAMLEHQLEDWSITHLSIGILPFWGPGNWFIPVIFGAILIMPLIYWLFTKSPTGALIVCFIVEFSMQIFVFFVIGPTYDSWEEFYLYMFIACNVLYYLSGIGIGMWFSFGHGIGDKRNLFIWVLFPLSVLYLIAWSQPIGYRLPSPPFFVRGDYHYISFIYSAGLFLLGMKLLPKESNNSLSRGLTVISKSTYHILLTQILYFGINFALYGDHYYTSIFGRTVRDPILGFMYLFINWLICIPLGILWYSGENKLREILKERRNAKINA